MVKKNEVKPRTEYLENRAAGSGALAGMADATLTPVIATAELAHLDTPITLPPGSSEVIAPTASNKGRLVAGTENHDAHDAALDQLGAHKGGWRDRIAAETDTSQLATSGPKPRIL